MYFWNTQALADELSKGTLSQDERMKYLLAYEMLFTAGIAVSSFMAEKVTLWLLIEAFIIVAITFIGIILCYQANKKGDNKEFIDRYICISWPILIKIIIIGIFVYVFYYIFGMLIWGELIDDIYDQTNVIDVIITSILTSLSYYYIRKHIINISSRCLTTG